MRIIILPAFALNGAVDGLRLLTGADYTNAARFMLAADALRGISLGVGIGAVLFAGLAALIRRLEGDEPEPSNVVYLADFRETDEPTPDDMA
jgi:hypothetical protein